MDVLFRVLRDPSPTLRASSLSTLGSICELMRFAMHPYTADIVAAVSHLLAVEKEPEVRRGTFLLLPPYILHAPRL